MKVKILTDGFYNTAKEAIGQIVEASADGYGIKVSAKELQRVGCVNAEGSPYYYFAGEIEVISNDS